MFSTIQIGITLVGILTGLYSGATFSGPLEGNLVANIPSIEPYAASLSSLLIVTLSPIYPSLLASLCRND